MKISDGHGQGRANSVVITSEVNSIAQAAQPAERRPIIALQYFIGIVFSLNSVICSRSRAIVLPKKKKRMRTKR